MTFAPVPVLATLATLLVVAAEAVPGFAELVGALGTPGSVVWLVLELRASRRAVLEEGARTRQWLHAIAVRLGMAPPPLPPPAPDPSASAAVPLPRP